ncbi:hypothetical protein LZQ00_06660 [Sphingobacterium sp. SRCM116780]|uniref:hypothetical protein n=1 Tax=Sphingobacterium sp. SRCM116780 TaxID=2907623 RepID=UPI001F1D5AD1|nr:hypothetical protein [Sphingobacterium sp. SRCM116780]UIR57494.1 hypothetical protein LZQ00_06660 [Sphingobacterium sp. SRCM116780]
MSTTEKNPYHLFNKLIWSNWKNQAVICIKVEELSQMNGITFFELIPDSELLDADAETLYPIDSDDVLDMFLPNAHVKFVVHDIYMDDLDD